MIEAVKEVAQSSDKSYKLQADEARSERPGLSSGSAKGAVADA
jgi:hypothetical protein